MKSQFTSLSEEELTFLISWGKIVRIPHDFVFVYEKHIPCAGVALLEGEIETIKKSKVIETLPASTIFGIHQLVNNKSVKKGYRIKGGSEIILISKSEIMEALKSPGSKFMKFIRRFL